MAQERLVASGSFCWNKDCPDYGKVNHGNIRRWGTTPGGIQRLQCRTCEVTFVVRKGTPFFGCHAPAELVLECLALLADRCSLAAIHRVKGGKEETVLAWLKKAAEHVEAIEGLLLANHRLTRVQMDALWTYVGHKGEKGGTRKQTIRAPSGVAQP